MFVACAAPGAGHETTAAENASTAAEEPDAAAPGPCVEARSEEECIGDPECGWDGSTLECIFIGAVEAQPGSGDPGGGGYSLDNFRHYRWIYRPRLSLPIPR
jgi:hypothetical protein